MNEKQCMDMAVKIQEVDSRSKSNEHRIDDCENEIKEIKTEQKAIYKIASSVEALAASMLDLQADVKEIRNGQKELNDKVTTLENQPAKRTYDTWQKIGYEAAKWFALATLGFFAARLGVF